MAAKAARHDANHIIDAVTSALRHGALPGENEEFNEEDCEDAARFMAGAIRIRAIGEQIIALETRKGVGNRRLMRLAGINVDMPIQIGNEAGRTRVRQYGSIAVSDEQVKKKKITKVITE